MKTDHGLPTAVVEHEAVNLATNSEVAAGPLVLIDHLGRIHGNSNKITGLPPSSLLPSRRPVSATIRIPRQIAVVLRAQQEPLLTPPFIDKLVEVMVLPTAGDAEILRSGADVREAVLAEDTLRRNVVRQSSCLNTVQPQVLEAQACGRGNGGSSDPTPVHLLDNPVAEVGGVESSSDDVVC